MKFKYTIDDDSFDGNEGTVAARQPIERHSEE